MISDVLMPNQIQFLQENYRLATLKSSDQTVLPSEDLMHACGVEHFINRQLTPLLNAPNGMVSASQFSKRYAFLVTAPFFASLTLFNQILNVGPKNTSVQPDPEKGFFLPRLALKDEGTTEAGLDRKEAVHRALEMMFKNHLKPVWETLNKVTCVPMPVLWENTATYFYWLYETNFYSHELGLPANKIEEDFQLILDAPGECFGETDNPLKKFHYDKQQLVKNDPPIRVRKTCCFYYEVNEERNFCKTCPKCLTGFTDQPSDESK
ncbi:IucA/IucC family C-terminal-domain containing protein [Pseudalkalibacillus sp. Hm43]|uniref:IucA/IucC family C-terminal-domain containing protein n=1 Tax=Pseudalkalibacillus sp. Hm43 TaxID=3450742 RepID=UPI003F43D1EA